MIEQNFGNSRLKAETLQFFKDHYMNCSMYLEQFIWAVKKNVFLTYSWSFLRDHPYITSANGQGGWSDKKCVDVIYWRSHRSNTYIKGQIEPKADWHAADSPKKLANEFVFIAFLLSTAKNTNSFVGFLGESMASKFAFGFIRPLEQLKFKLKKIIGV